MNSAKEIQALFLFYFIDLGEGAPPVEPNPGPEDAHSTALH